MDVGNPETEIELVANFRVARHPLAISQPPRIGLLERAFSRT